MHSVLVTHIVADQLHVLNFALPCLTNVVGVSDCLNYSYLQVCASGEIATIQRDMLLS